MKNDQGEVYGFKGTSGNKTRDLGTSYYYQWKQDSLIWQAEELLRARDYDQAATAYATALAEHPEHFYLYEAQSHLDYIRSKTPEDLKQLYQRYVGQYGVVSIWVENGELFYKRPGLARRILRPVSDQEFITLYSYDIKYGFEMENGVVKGMYMYNYDNEGQSWKRSENWYYARTQLAD